jgi:acetyl esterase/lipase
MTPTKKKLAAEHGPYPTSHTRHAYRDNNNFEQSLDVYVPGLPASADLSSLPVVLLVVGSGWMGHRALIYAGCSWWNASGPKTVASAGATCVCVRHRGAFPPPDGRLLFLGAGLAGLQLANFCWAPAAELGWGYGWAGFQALCSAGAWLALSALWRLGASGSARFDDMLEDVAAAMRWVKEHGDVAGAPTVLGGYSSGGHVLSSLMLRPDIMEKHGVGVEDIKGVLLLSPLLATCPGGTFAGKMRAFTDLVMDNVWGAARGTVPSPLHDVLNGGGRGFPPHLLVGCRSET